MSKTINPKHDPAPNSEHKRYISAESDNFTFISYMPQDQYGFIRIVHHDRTGTSTGYLDITTDTTAGKEHPAIADLHQLQNEYLTLRDVSLHVNTHNDIVRRITKQHFTDFEVSQQIAEKKRTQEEANKPKALTLDEEREGRALKKAATNLTEAAVRNFEPRVRNRKWHTTMANSAKRRVDDLTALQFDANAIAQEQEKYEYHKQFADELPALQAELQQLQEAAQQAYAKTAREYWEEAHQHA